MANVFNLLSEETFAEKLDTQNTLLAALVNNSGGVSITSPSDIQSIVRLGLASKIFVIGDQIACQKGSTTLIWDIIGIDHDTPSNKNLKHSLTLQLHDCISFSSFDAPEALFYAENSIPAGTYNFTVTQTTWIPSDVGKTYQFTLTQDVPAGGHIVLYSTYFSLGMSATSIKTYTNGAETTPIETVSLTEGSDGTSLGNVSNAVNGNTNSLERALLGSNNYAESNIRQYLNSNASQKNMVWTPQTKFDRRENWDVLNVNGFLYEMDEDFLAVIGKVDKVTTLNTVSDGGGSVTTSDKFFLLSCPEVYGNMNTDDGTVYQYYYENSDLSIAGNGIDTNRIKYENNVAKDWALRSPAIATAYNATSVTSRGKVDQLGLYGACTLCYIAPACCIV
jgi:hypothetical protein